MKAPWPVLRRLHRLRGLITLLLYLLGFLAPWESNRLATGTLWLALSTAIARSGWTTLEHATLTVTLVALACLASGTSLLVWAASRSVRNPRSGQTSGSGSRFRSYVGDWLYALGISILMPPSGALFFLLALTVLLAFPVYAEDLDQNGDRSSTAPPHTLHWPQAALAMVHPIAFTVCFAIFAWRYNARILVRCLLICYGVSLVLRAFSRDAGARAIRTEM